jgi:thioredoxin 1
MSLRKAGTAVITGLVATALLISGCAKESAEEESRAGKSPATFEAGQAEPDTSQQPATSPQMAEASERADTQGKTSAGLPRLVDLGRETCIPCKMMTPILEELKKEYEGRAVIEVIDLREHREAAREYGIRVIPTQIFFDADGNEIWRHSGFLAKADIVARFSEMGVPPGDN